MKPGPVFGPYAVPVPKSDFGPSETGADGKERAVGGAGRPLMNPASVFGPYVVLGTKPVFV